MLWTALYFVWVLLFRGQTLTFTRTLTVQFCYLVFIAANYYFQVFKVAIPCGGCGRKNIYAYIRPSPFPPVLR